MLTPYDQPRKALVLGSSGLIGEALVDLLLNDIAFEQVILLNRRQVIGDHPKVKELIVDFQDFSQYQEAFREVDVVFCCIGTTIKKAGSKEAFRQIDYHIPVEAARMAHLEGVPKFIVVSSLGADSRSGNFYLKTKGEMERDIALYRFHKLAIIRPSLLLGPRKEFRLGERIAQFFNLLISPILVGPFKKFVPIHRDTVARAMLNLSYSVNNQRIYQADNLAWLGK